MMKSSHRSLTVLRPLGGVVLMLTLSACASYTDAPAPAAALPAAYLGSVTSTAATPAADWWRSFGSSELSALVTAALAANADLAMAAERVRQAEAQARMAQASLFPALSFGAGASRRETRGNGDVDTGASALNVNISASYELDFWGQNSSALRSAEYALSATQFDRETLRLTLISGVASAYFQILALQERVRLARENLRIAERVFKVVKVRADNGAVSSLDVARQQAVLLGQQVALLPLQLQLRQIRYALALLLDTAPQDVVVTNESLLALSVPDVAAGVPSSLLLRRPDLASLEAQLAASNANLTVARAALLPSMSLTGSAGAASSSLSGLIGNPALTLSLGASLMQAIFDGGRLRAQVDMAASRERELVLAYRKAALAALVDVENALAARSRSGEQELLLTQSQQQAARVLRLAEVRYREGSDDLLVLLDAQRTLFQAADQLAQIRQSRLQATLDLIKALGGGWNAAG
jgi:NodT family efflux transporter outer membrane factor (OMF) lipoprotein